VAPEVSTFFFTKLKEAGPPAVAKWIPKLKSCHHLVIPLNFSWVLCVAYVNSNWPRKLHWALGVVMNLAPSSQKKVRILLSFGSNELL
jgi:Ulp1 family protease